MLRCERGRKGGQRKGREEKKDGHDKSAAEFNGVWICFATYLSGGYCYCGCCDRSRDPQPPT